MNTVTKLAANTISKLFTIEICSFLLTKNFHAHWGGISFNYATDNKLCDIVQTGTDEYRIEIYKTDPMKRIATISQIRLDQIIPSLLGGK